MAAHKGLSTAAIAATSYKVGKKRAAKKNASLKRGASKGKTGTGGNVQPPYTIIPSSTVALPPGAGPPMSSTQTGGRASTSSAISSLRSGASSSRARKKRGARKR